MIQSLSISTRIEVENQDLGPHVMFFGKGCMHAEDGDSMKQTAFSLGHRATCCGGHLVQHYTSCFLLLILLLSIGGKREYTIILFG